MATLATRERGVPGDRTVVHFTITMGTYATGGESLNLLTYLGLSKIDSVHFESDATRRYSYDRTNAKVLAWTAAAEVANATDLSAVTVRGVAWGVKAT